MINSIHAALWDWFLQCTSIAKLFFNFSDAEDSSTVITTAGDTLIEEYIDGSQLRRYSFELNRYCPITFVQNDDGNIRMLEETHAIARWAQQQNDKGNMPILPDNCTAESVELLDEYAGYATAVNENIAKYMLPFAITYYKTKG